MVTSTYRFRVGDVDHLPDLPAVDDGLDLLYPGRVAQHVAHGQDNAVLLAHRHDLSTVSLRHLPTIDIFLFVSKYICISNGLTKYVITPHALSIDCTIL